MKDFADKMAVVTGGGTGMGRELVCQLIQAGAHVAMCDVSEVNMAETQKLANVQGDQRLTSHICDVSSQAQLDNFRVEVLAQHDVAHINLLFNNAGIGSGVSFVDGDRDEWERTFNIYWYGVYYNARAFMPYLVAADKAHMVNTSSVKGFTEALVTDLRINAPHVKVSVVMLGHIGTSIIASNSGKISGHADPIDMSGEEIEQIRKRVEKLMEIDLSATTNDQIWEVMKAQSEPYLD